MNHATAKSAEHDGERRVAAAETVFEQWELQQKSEPLRDSSGRRRRRFTDQKAERRESKRLTLERLLSTMPRPFG